MGSWTSLTPPLPALLRIQKVPLVSIDVFIGKDIASGKFIPYRRQDVENILRSYIFMKYFGSSSFDDGKKG